MRKRLLTFLLAASAVIAGALGLSACNHTHTFTDKVIDPTCIGPGYTLHSCGCGYSYTDSFRNSISHTFTQEVAEDKYLKTAVTCTTKGVYYKSCAGCGEIGTDTFECEPKGHTFTKELAEDKYLVSKATCIDKAVYHKSCVDCGETGTDIFEYGSLGEHTEVIDEAVAPSCIDGKTEGKHCSVCSTVLVEQTAIKANGQHVWDDNVCSSCKLDAGGSKGITWVLNKNKTGYYVDDYGNCQDTEVIIPSVYNGLPVTKICDYALAGSKITSIIIPDSVTSIGDSAFEDCDSLKSITIPDSVTSIGDSVFEECRELTSVILGNGITSISEDAFWLCYKLSSVTFGNNVTYIGRNAFNACYELTSITIPDTVTAIDDGAFEGCGKLQSFTFPDGIKVIDYYVLYDSGVTEITVPVSVTNIERCALLDCTYLKKINYKGTMAQWKAIVINEAWEDNMDNFVIICTDGKLDKDGNEID